MKILKKIFDKCESQSGSTIVELLIALMVVGLVATAVAVAATYSIKNTGEARFKQVATILGQEVIEKSRAEKNRLGFINFNNAVGGNLYCFGVIPASFDLDLPSPGNCGVSEVVTVAGADFTREATFSFPSATETTVEISVSWVDGESTRTVELVQKFSKSDQSF